MLRVKGGEMETSKCGQLAEVCDVTAKLSKLMHSIWQLIGGGGVGVQNKHSSFI